MQVNFMDPNSQPLQAPVMPTQGQGLAQLQMPGQPQKQGGMQFSPDQISKLAEMLKGFGQQGQMGSMGAGMQPSMPMAGGMFGGGSMPSFGGS